MNWDAVGAIGEIIGAAAVVATLLVLVVQIRHSTRAVEESNRLDLAAAIDRHSDSIGRWRGLLASDADLSRIWIAAQDDEPLERLDHVRFANLWIVLTNTQRANFRRAQTVGAPGLARQSVLSVAVMAYRSRVMQAEWEMTKPWHEIESPEWVADVDAAMEELRSQADPVFREAGSASRKPA